MRLAGLGAIAALGAMLTMPVFAQTPAIPATPVMPARPAMPAMPTLPAAKPAMPTATTSAPTAATPAAKPGKHVRGTGPVNLNTATAEELDDLKYIGKARAKKIIDGRPWADGHDLVTKKILTEKQFGEDASRIVVK